MSSLRPTTREIASVAGVSQSTVSLALRNHPAIAQATRDHVRNVAEKLGYRPNPLVSAWMSHVSSTRKATFRANIAYIRPAQVADGERDHYLEGINALAPSCGYVVDTFISERYKEKPQELQELFQTRGVSGILLHTELLTAEAPDLNWSEFSVVCLGPSGRFHSVQRDYSAELDYAIRKLAQGGHLVIGVALTKTASLYLKGCHEAKRVKVYGNDSFLNLSRWLKDSQATALVCDTSPRETLSGVETIVIGETDRDLAINIGKVAVDVLSGMLCQNERGIPTYPRRVCIRGGGE